MSWTQSLRYRRTIQFSGAPNTVLLPHIGFETSEALSAKAEIALRYLEDFLNAPHQQPV